MRRLMNFGPDPCEFDNPYDAVKDAIFKDIPYPTGSYLVQMKIKAAYEPEDKYQDITELLIDDREKSSDEPSYVWENDWWEGEEDLIIVAVAKIEDIDLSAEFPFE